MRGDDIWRTYRNQSLAHDVCGGRYIFCVLKSLTFVDCVLGSCHLFLVSPSDSNIMLLLNAITEVSKCEQIQLLKQGWNGMILWKTRTNTQLYWRWYSGSNVCESRSRIPRWIVTLSCQSSGQETMLWKCHVNTNLTLFCTDKPMIPNWPKSTIQNHLSWGLAQRIFDSRSTEVSIVASMKCTSDMALSSHEYPVE
jgi:hypothetical protein